MTTIKGTKMEMVIEGNDIDVEEVYLAKPTTTVEGNMTFLAPNSPLRAGLQTIYMRPGRTPISLIARIAWKLSWWLRNMTEYPAFRWGQYSSKEYALTGTTVDEMNEKKVDNMTQVDVSWTADKVSLYNEAYGNWQQVDNCEKEWTEDREVT